VEPPDHRPNSDRHLPSGRPFINSLMKKGTKRRREFVPIVIWSCPRYAKAPQWATNKAHQQRTARIRTQPIKLVSLWNRVPLVEMVSVYICVAYLDFYSLRKLINNRLLFIFLMFLQRSFCISRFCQRRSRRTLRRTNTVTGGYKGKGLRAILEWLVWVKEMVSLMENTSLGMHLDGISTLHQKENIQIARGENTMQQPKPF